MRPTGIEPMSVRWRRTALPLSYGRWCIGTVHRAGLEPAEPEGTWFTARPRCRLSICARLLEWCGRSCDRPHRCWRKADGSNAAPCGAHPFSRRVAGHSSGTFRLSWTSRRDLNARPPPSDGGALVHLSYETKSRPRAARPSRGSPSSSRADSRAGTRAWPPATR